MHISRHLLAVTAVFFFLFFSSRALAESEILFPPPNTSVVEPYVSIAGKSTPNTTINWQQVRKSGIETGEATVNSSGVFNITLTLDPGKNQIVAGGTALLVYYNEEYASKVKGFFGRAVHAGDISVCEDCHDKFTSEVLEDGYPQVCLSCHVVVSQNPENYDEALSYSHFSAVASNCGTCHEPHYSVNWKLLKKEAAQKPCATCHSSNYATAEAHPALEEGGCSACHDSHYSGYKKNLHQDMPGVCQECHDQGVGISSSRFHPPGAHSENWCSKCHDPHGTGEYLLNASQGALCAGCHGQVLELGHQDELEECNLCHDPHISLAQKGLLKPDFPAGCAECHDDKAEGKTVHPPVEEGCEICHNPHSDENVDMALNMCTQCHNVGHDSDLARIHGNLPMELTDCLMCHPLHVSDQPMLVKAKTHFPLTQGKCDACHGQGAEANRKIADAGPRCSKCHSTLRDLESMGATIHDPVESDGCDTCHDPHMSNFPKYLNNEMGKVCADCHDEAEVEKGKTLHEAAETCSDCHGVHGGEGAKFLASQPPELCFDCHDDPAEEKKVVHDALDEGCTSCHDPHSGVGASLLIMDTPELCLECHDDPTEGGEAHPAIDDGCTACHNPHATDNAGLLSDDADALCIECHDDPAEDKKVVHDALDEGCTACHDPHVSKGGPLLAGSVNAVCAECHDPDDNHHDIDAANAGDWEGGKFPVDGAELSCVGCHNPHASDGGVLYPIPEDDLCNNCH